MKSSKRKLLSRLLFLVNCGFAFALLASYTATWISPIDFWPLAFFGISYPFILLGNVLFLVFWLWRGKRKNALISSLSFLIGLAFFFDFFQISLFDGAEDENNTQIKVMSYNVRLFDFYNFTENKNTRNEIIAELQEVDPDIMCFQEFYHTDQVGRFTTRDTIVPLLRTKNVHEHYTHEMRGKQYFGVVTMSSYPMINKGNIPFENDPNNFCIFSDLKIGNDTLRVYNTHLASIRFGHDDYSFVDQISQGNGGNLKSGSRQIAARLKRAFVKRAHQVHKIMEHVKASPYPVLLCGDFNDTPISYCYAQFDDVLTDAFTKSGNGTGATYIGKFPSFRIDYIFHDPKLNSYDFEVREAKLSDHHAIQCTLELPAEKD